MVYDLLWSTVTVDHSTALLIAQGEHYVCVPSGYTAVQKEAIAELAKKDKEDKKEAEKNNQAARLWITGIEAVNRTLGSEGILGEPRAFSGVGRVFDLSATPFFLKGSGYAEGTLFPWTMSDF